MAAEIEEEEAKGLPGEQQQQLIIYDVEKVVSAVEDGVDAPILPKAAAPSSSLSIGSLAGIIVGSVVGTLVVLVLLYAAYRKWWRKPPPLLSGENSAGKPPVYYKAQQYHSGDSQHRSRETPRYYSDDPQFSAAAAKAREGAHNRFQSIERMTGLQTKKVPAVVGNPSSSDRGGGGIGNEDITATEEMRPDKLSADSAAANNTPPPPLTPPPPQSPPLLLRSQFSKSKEFHSADRNYSADRNPSADLNTAVIPKSSNEFKRRTQNSEDQHSGVFRVSGVKSPLDNPHYNSPVIYKVAGVRTPATASRMLHHHIRTPSDERLNIAAANMAEDQNKQHFVVGNSNTKTPKTKLIDKKRVPVAAVDTTKPLVAAESVTKKTPLTSPRKNENIYTNILTATAAAKLAAPHIESPPDIKKTKSASASRVQSGELDLPTLKPPKLVGNTSKLTTLTTGDAPNINNNDVNKNVIAAPAPPPPKKIINTDLRYFFNPKQNRVVDKKAFIEKRLIDVTGDAFKTHGTLFSKIKTPRIKYKDETKSLAPIVWILEDLYKNELVRNNEKIIDLKTAKKYTNKFLLDYPEIDLKSGYMEK